jgi:ribonuclease Z
MKIHCLGTAGYHPSDTRQTSCYFVPQAGIVLDAGTGFYRLPSLIETSWLDIFLSHGHLDHTVGLTFLLDVVLQHPVETVRVWAEPVKLQAIQEHLFSDHMFPAKIKVEWCEIIPGAPIAVGENGTLTSFPLTHPGGSMGFRIDWPKHGTLAYVTDTTGAVDADYVSHISGCDLLMHECNFRDGAEEWAIMTGHTWTTRAAEVALAAEAKKLLLIHMNPIEPDDDPVGIENARRLFPETQVAYDKLVVNLR